MPYTTPSQYVFDDTNSVPQEIIDAALYNLNQQNAQAATNSTRALALEILSFINNMEVVDYIRNFDSAKISKSVNTFTIAADAIIAWNNATKSEVTGWSAKTFDLTSNPTEMANNFQGFLWAEWDGGSTKDYHLTSRLITAPANYGLLASYAVDSSGNITFDHHVSRFWEQAPTRFQGLVYLYGGIAGTTKYPPYFYQCPAILRTSASQVYIPVGLFKDDTFAIDIDVLTPQTIDISTTGLNGVCQSANLTGTIAVSSGAATVTGTGTAFTTDFTVGDVIRTNGGQARRIIAIASNTSLTVESNWSSNESGVAFKRGGEAPNTKYYIYAVLSSVTNGYVLSTRNAEGGQTLVDLPSGVAYKRQLQKLLYNNTSGDIQSALITINQPLPANYHNVTIQYTSASTITIKAGSKVRSLDNTTDIVNVGNIIVNITTSGANGLDTGSEGNDTWYYLYAIYNPTTGQTAYLLSTTNEAVSGSITLPSGYTKKRQIPAGAVYNGSGGDIEPFQDIYSELRCCSYSNPVSILSGGSSGSKAQINCNTAVPETSNKALFNFTFSQAASSTIGTCIWYPAYGTATIEIGRAAAASTWVLGSNSLESAIDETASRRVGYQWNTANHNLQVWVTKWFDTKVQ